MMNNVCDLTYNIQLTPITFCKYHLEISDKKMVLTFPQLLQLREKLIVLTTFTKLEEVIATDNFVLLFVADKTHLLFLDIPQLLDLKDEISLFFNDFKRVSF